MFSGQETNVHDNAALALLLRLPREAETTSALGLSWCGKRADDSGASKDSNRSALSVLKLLLKGGEPIVSDFGRLIWTWKYHGAPA